MRAWLAGDLGGIATLSAPGAIILSGLTTEAPSANGKVGISGTLDKLVQVLSVVQDAEPMPYRGSYEIAQTVAWLCDPAAHNLTGTSIAIDGGWTAQ